MIPPDDKEAMAELMDPVLLCVHAYWVTCVGAMNQASKKFDVVATRHFESESTVAHQTLGKLIAFCDTEQLPLKTKFEKPGANKIVGLDGKPI